VKKVAIVTGAASGIGLACAERLAADGCIVVLADVNDQAGLEQSKRIGASFVAADLSRREGCKQLVEKTLAKHSSVRLIEPAEVAGFVAYLCSDAAGVITGAALTMDLGWTAR
jgi:NAD(P)-dependent dehydrogenase (short-subunit alcohol dehydrogenase family)